jgi:DNA-binding transcriptional MerR regulator
MAKAKKQEKLFYRIEEVSRLTKLDPEVIAGWEKEFPFLQPGQTGSGQKIFRPRDVEIILRIKALLDEKSVTLAGAKRRIEEEMGLRTPSTVHPDKLRKMLLQVRDELQSILESIGPRAKKS